jgi:hypothetical protein
VGLLGVLTAAGDLHLLGVPHGILADRLPHTLNSRTENICVPLSFAQYQHLSPRSFTNNLQPNDTVSNINFANIAPCAYYNPRTAVCEECPENGYLNEYGVCQNCIENCASCDSRATCKQCNDGYYWNPNTNFINTTNVTLRLSLEYGSGGCYPCSDPLALTCSINGGQSLTCKPNTYLDMQNSRRHVCLECVAGCEECDNTLKCETCQDNWFIYEEVCYKCPVNCLLCEDQGLKGICDTCQDGYQLVQGQCQSCKNKISGCTSCSTITVSGREKLSCEECDNG